MTDSLRSVLSKNAQILRSKASKSSLQAVIVAAAAIVVATLLASYTADQSVSVEGIMHVQMTNPVLWMLDFLPFMYAYIGQYSGYLLAQEASLMVMEQTEEIRRHADQLEQQAVFASTHDLVTELPNRVLFCDRIERLLRDRNQWEKGAAVLNVAIENLKEIQDTLGMPSADHITKQLATRLVNWASPGDSVARIDNISFGILLCEGSHHKGLEAKVKNLLKAIEPHFVLGNLKLTLQAAIGVAVFPEHGEDADTLLQQAAVAQFYGGKSFSGYSFYSPNMDENSPRRLTLMSELKHAMERNELQLYFQPKIELGEYKVVGVEVLARWMHKLHGYVSPDEFISLAERTRIIRPLTQWVLENAFTTCARWHKQGLVMKMSINLSAKDLHDPELPDQIAGIAAKTGVQPEWIAFEITETSIMSDPTRVLIIVERLKGMGYEMSIDDFGTGYSSLAYLRKLPVSELKIDKSFVIDMDANENDTIIVRATIDLAHNLGLRVTAEGVERQEITDTLIKMGCDLGQGHFFSKPLAENDFIDWIKNKNV